MISEGEVGAVFTIVDEASPIIRTIAEQFNKLQAQIDKLKLSFKEIRLPPSVEKSIATMTAAMDAAVGSAGKLEASMGDIGAAAESGSTKAAASFGKIDDSIATTQGKLAALKAELRATGGVGGIGGGGAPPIRARALGHGGGGHFNNQHIPTPGGSGFSVPGGPLMAAGAAVGYGAFLESEFEDQAARMILTGQMNRDVKMTDMPVFKQIRETLQSISQSTGYSPKEVGEAMLGVERQFAGLSLDKRLTIESTISPYAAAEARLKETDFKDSFEALVGLTHMTGTYDPAKIPELMREFSYASLITPASISQFRNALSYSLPILHAGLDMDPGSVMFLTSMMQTAGVTNTKSGTWLRSFFERAAPPLDDTPASLKRLGALERMGLADDQRRQLWMVNGANGKPDWDASILKLSESINRWAKATRPVERIATLQAGFGERGGGFGALMNLPEFIGQFPNLESKMKAFQGGADVVDYLAKNSPMQQFRTAWADAQNVLMDVGSIALPGVTGALREFDGELKALKKLMGGDNSAKSWHDLVFGPSKPESEKGWFEKLEDRIANNPIAHANQAIGKWLYDRAWGNPDTSVPGPGATHIPNGRDPRSPSTGPFAYYPPAAPAPHVDVKVGETKVNVQATLDGAAIAATIISRVEKGLVSILTGHGTNSDSGFDARSAPIYPDTVGGVGHQ